MNTPHAAPRAPSLDEVRAARTRIAGLAQHTPLVSFDHRVEAPELFLKLENLQPIGAFKIRGAANAMAVAIPETLAHGVYTASAGNMAQGVAFCARARGIACAVMVPEHAPRAKTDAIERFGGSVIRVPFEQWWQTMLDHGAAGMTGQFIHPFADSAVMAGNGTIALELFEALASDVDAILVPYGGGGLACGIAAAARALRPDVKIYAVEVDTAAPLTASFAAGHPTVVTRTRTFIDGMGSDRVVDEMWPLARDLLSGTVVVTVAQIADAVRQLAIRTRTIAEGAGASSLAAALTLRTPNARGANVVALQNARRVVGIVSGGNIDHDVLSTILRGETPA